MSWKIERLQHLLLVSSIAVIVPLFFFLFAIQDLGIRAMFGLQRGLFSMSACGEADNVCSQRTDADGEVFKM